jgi:hypothetical protein
VKATLEFDLPEEREEFELASKGTDWMLVLWEIDQNLRNSLKHGHEYKTADEAMEKMRELIGQEMSERGLYFH